MSLLNRASSISSTKPVALLVLALSAGVALVYSLSALDLIRIPVVFFFLLFGPGLGWIPLLKQEDFLELFTLSLALSLAFDIIVALIFLYTGGWSVDWMLVVLTIIAVSGALVQLKVAAAAFLPKSLEKGE
ncbi:MAG TPA: hypothetical protein VH186_07775 [Chloroflexia bacterium]|nr:hypothetical protein [Chloroflexia bacterium]